MYLNRTEPIEYNKTSSCSLYRKPQITIAGKAFQPHRFLLNGTFTCLVTQIMPFNSKERALLSPDYSFSG